MEGQWASAGGEVSLHNFSARLWEQLVHFHVMRLTDSLFLWVGATPHLRNLAVAMCSRYDSIPVSTSLLGDTSDTTSTGLAQRLVPALSFPSTSLPALLSRRPSHVLLAAHKMCGLGGLSLCWALSNLHSAGLLLGCNTPIYLANFKCHGN
uniref:Proteasome assembly chaperone 4 n=1 Tax=Rhinolophus ferrumequinum TaxID=59479 RepID=A0A671DL53_RHIFE